MFSILAGLIYVLAIVLPVWLLYRYASASWYWHALALVAALAVGFAPGTALLQTVAGTFVYGFVFCLLAVWGIGGMGMIFYRRFAHKTLAEGQAVK
jgi:hypothetical protein